MMFYLAFVVIFFGLIYHYNESFGFVSCLFSDYLKWNGHSATVLEQSETSILSSNLMKIYTT